MLKIIVIITLFCPILCQAAQAVESRDLTPSGKINLNQVWIKEGGARMYWRGPLSPTQINMNGSAFIDPASVPNLSGVNQSRKNMSAKRSVKKQAVKKASDVPDQTKTKKAVDTQNCTCPPGSLKPAGAAATSPSVCPCQNAKPALQLKPSTTSDKKEPSAPVRAKSPDMSAETKSPGTSTPGGAKQTNDSASIPKEENSARPAPGAKGPATNTKTSLSPKSAQGAAPAGSGSVPVPPVAMPDLPETPPLPNAGI